MGCIVNCYTYLEYRKAIMINAVQSQRGAGWCVGGRNRSWGSLEMGRSWHCACSPVRAVREGSATPDWGLGARGACRVLLPGWARGFSICSDPRQELGGEKERTGPLASSELTPACLFRFGKILQKRDAVSNGVNPMFLWKWIVSLLCPCCPCCSQLEDAILLWFGL